MDLNLENFKNNVNNTNIITFPWTSNEKKYKNKMKKFLSQKFLLNNIVPKYLMNHFQYFIFLDKLDIVKHILDILSDDEFLKNPLISRCINDNDESIGIICHSYDMLKLLNPIINWELFDMDKYFSMWKLKDHRCIDFLLEVGYNGSVCIFKKHFLSFYYNEPILYSILKNNNIEKELLSKIISHLNFECLYNLTNNPIHWSLKNKKFNHICLWIEHGYDLSQIYKSNSILENIKKLIEETYKEFKTTCLNYDINKRYDKYVSLPNFTKVLNLSKNNERFFILIVTQMNNLEKNNENLKEYETISSCIDLIFYLDKLIKFYEDEHEVIFHYLILVLLSDGYFDFKKNVNENQSEIIRYLKIGSQLPEELKIVLINHLTNTNNYFLKSKYIDNYILNLLMNE